MKDVIVAILNKPNANHRIYTKESLKVIPEKVPVTLGTSLEDLDGSIPDIIGEASNIRVEGDLLMADISLNLPVPEEISFAICGDGDVINVGSPYRKHDDDATVVDFVLKSVSTLPPDQNAFLLGEKK